MSENTPILEALHIPKPCHEDWQAMHGNAQQRFCNSCQHHVVNLSAMTPDAAETVIATAHEQQQSLCVRYTVSATGGVLTRPSWRWYQVRQWHRLPKSLLRSVRHATQRAAATVAVVTLVGAFCVMPAANAQPQATLGAPIVSQTAQPSQQARDIPPRHLMGAAPPPPQIMGEMVMPEPVPKPTSPQNVKQPATHKPKTQVNTKPKNKAITGKVRPPKPPQPKLMGKPASPNR